MEIIVEDPQMILNKLDFLDINEATLFPEIDKIAHYLVSKIN